MQYMKIFQNFMSEGYEAAFAQAEFQNQARIIAMMRQLLWLKKWPVNARFFLIFHVKNGKFLWKSRWCNGMNDAKVTPVLSQE
jgi:hypothetical protein